MKILGIVTALALLISHSSGLTIRSDADDDRTCRPYFGSACSEAIGRWLPYLGTAGRIPATVSQTTVTDAIVDPAGVGPEVFLNMHGPARGTLAVFGSAGPPKAHVVYDPVHRIAYYDVGCCSWHRVVLAAGVPAPPRTVAMRTLTGLHTERGIRLGDRPERVAAAYGRAALPPPIARSGEMRLTYWKTKPNASPYSPCDSANSFVFKNDRLVEITFDIEC
jgi:hypothetical protein